MAPATSLSSDVHSMVDHAETPAAKKLKPNIEATETNETDWRSNVRGEKDLVTPRPAWWWTGQVPEDCPGWHSEGYLTSLPLPDLSKVTRESTLKYFENTWAITETLFSALQGEEPFYRPPYHQLRHPLIFYYGHPAVFYINKLRVAGMLDHGINDHFESIFEVGVDEMSWDDLSKNDMEWPSVKQVNEYRRKAFSMVCEVIRSHPALEELPVSQDKPAWCLFMAFEHERIHIETSSVLMRELPIELVRAPVQWPPYHPSALESAQAPPNAQITVPAADVAVGKPLDWPTFGWDNEYGQRKMHVRQFSASKFLVSNAEFFEFVKAGGYRTHKYWSDCGWQWRTFRNAKWPTFWVAHGPEGLHQYRLRLCWDVLPMAWGLPVDVNVHEAQAYCAWLAEKDGERPGSYRLLSEGEHHRLRGEGALLADPVMADKHPAHAQANTNLRAGSQSAVHALPPNAAGFHDVFGSVWQWCLDTFAALPGFKVHSMYDDFSTPCFDGQHSIIMGGSWASSGDLASVFARYHFRPHFFQHAGFRVVKSEHEPLLTSMDAPPPYAAGWVPPSSDPSKQTESMDTTTALTSQMLQQHFSPTQSFFQGAGGALESSMSGMSSYPKRVAALLMAAAAKLKVPTARALDVGCAVGGSCFELARQCPEVLGLEQSAHLVEAANSLRASGSMQVFRQDEGELGSMVSVKVDPAIDRRRVAFKQMDAMCLSPALGEFDLVVVSNLLEHLISPMACLGRLGGRQGVVRRGGLVAVASTFDWDARLTPQDLWLGGNHSKDDQERWSRPGLTAAMGPCFELVQEEEMPLVTRVNARKYQVQVTNVTVWRRLT